MVVEPLPPKRRAVPYQGTPSARRRLLGARLAIGLLCSIAVTLAVRRGVGALMQPLHAGALLACAAFMLLVAIALRRLAAEAAGSQGIAAVWHAAALAALMVMAWSFSLPNSNLPAVALVWLAAIMPEVVARVPWSRLKSAMPPRHASVLREDADNQRSQPSMMSPSKSPTHDQASPSCGACAAEESNEADEIEEEAADFDPHVVQQFTRLRHDDGQESVTGWCRVRFAKGQRQASSHLAFCPPLNHAPAVELEQLDGPDARLKAGQTLPQGARIELKLADAPTEPSEVLYRFHAR